MPEPDASARGAEASQGALSEEQRQALVLALAHLAQERPGWHAFLRGIAAALHGAALYDELHAMPKRGVWCGDHAHSRAHDFRGAAGRAGQ
mgnify:CR=1 FL=1